MKAYAPVVEVRARHEFYGEAENETGPCPGLSFIPLPHTQTLLDESGLVFRPQPCGFRILAPSLRFRLDEPTADGERYRYEALLELSDPVDLLFGVEFEDRAFVVYTQLPERKPGSWYYAPPKPLGDDVPFSAMAFPTTGPIVYHARGLDKRIHFELYDARARRVTQQMCLANDDLCTFSYDVGASQAGVYRLTFSSEGTKRDIFFVHTDMTTRRASALIHLRAPTGLDPEAPLVVEPSFDGRRVEWTYHVELPIESPLIKNDPVIKGPSSFKRSQPDPANNRRWTFVSEEPLPYRARPLGYSLYRNPTAAEAVVETLPNPSILRPLPEVYVHV